LGGGDGSITGILPNQRSGVINWENLCEQAKSLHEHFIREDCDDLADGTQLTPEGVRVILCLRAGAYLLLIDPFQFAAAQSAAREAGLNEYTDNARIHPIDIKNKNILNNLLTW
jgi:hypothetical protein